MLMTLDYLHEDSNLTHERLTRLNTSIDAQTNPHSLMHYAHMNEIHPLTNEEPQVELVKQTITLTSDLQIICYLLLHISRLSDESALLVVMYFNYNNCFVFLSVTTHRVSYDGVVGVYATMNMSLGLADLFHPAYFKEVTGWVSPPFSPVTSSNS
jgi:hypothetical protein